MKRLVRIFPVMMLSLLIIVMSAGLSMEVCLHTGRTELAQIAEAQGCEHHDGMKGCMMVKTVKLAPSTLAHSHVFDFTQQWVTLEPLSSLEALIPPFTLAYAHLAYAPQWHAPPRDYLHKIRVLRL